MKTVSYILLYKLCLLEEYKVCLKSSVNGAISERQLDACVHACAWFFRHMGRIDTQNGLHMTGSVTAQWSNVQTSSTLQIGENSNGDA